MKNIAIIGAGPAGLLMAYYLLRRGYTVDVFEKSSDPSNDAMFQERSFPVSFHQRARLALQHIPGLDEEMIKYGRFCNTSIIHRGGRQKHIDRKRPMLSISRNRIVLILLKGLRREYDERRLNIHFDSQCQAINDDEKVISIVKTLSGSDPQISLTKRYDVLIGADGAHSVVRQHLTQAYGVESSSRTFPVAYKSILIDHPEEDSEHELDRNAVHFSPVGDGGQVILVPQPNNILCGSIDFPIDRNVFETWTTADDVKEFFNTHCPVFTHLVGPEQAQDILERPESKITTVMCNQFHYGEGILIMGDAAHAVVPSLGQGCNSALHDVAIIGQLLDDFDDNWAAVLPEFSKRRVAETHAMIELSDHAFPRSKRLMIELILRTTVSKKLSKFFPKRFHPSMFDLVWDSDLSFQEILKLNQKWIQRIKRYQMTSS